MKLRHIFTGLAVIILLAAFNRVIEGTSVVTYGGLSWIGWASIALAICTVGFVVMLNDYASGFGFFRRRNLGLTDLEPVRTLNPSELTELGLSKYRGPAYPHPVIFPDRCIGCQACVDACPHDVLAIVDGRAAAVAPDLCMEETACQAECPVNPKACIVINTTKQVRSLPAPVRDGSTYQTNVPGCYIIGDVSGVPLIKNAVKEGHEVITRIAEELGSLSVEPKAALDVAIIGVGPGGASAAARAQDLRLRYVAIEQDQTLSSVVMYPKGKYIFFKPDTKDWFGGIKVTGLGLSKSNYGDDDTETIVASLGEGIAQAAREQVESLHDEIIERVPSSFRSEASPLLRESLEKQFARRIAGFLKSRGSGNWGEIYNHHFLPDRANILAAFRSDLADQLQTKIPGDQRENILAVWLGNLADKGVRINEFESCKAVNRGKDGDYFVIETERGAAKDPQTYTARRVVIAVGLRGAPNTLRLPNEDLKISVDGRQQQKVQYALTNPTEHRGRRLVVVGGGNAAVEAAVDLAASRVGTSVVPRPLEERNHVTLLVRDYLAPTVKFGNKFLMYHCMDEGMLDVRFGVGIKEMREHELVLEDVQTKTVVDTISNDYVFALIGGERPTRFLQSIGIDIV